ncbi:hypothetical protein DNTS_009813 [Danionella cerebrum]|uniref:G-protein coupled receptors family 1 profile domain-containing protein n=1 Tax=Danionella cerebrum TaxID=2873325 RepID=A0A553MXL2_9TELE|nr:hypothetical protein DNTS_009813 [Danionella translucida]
MEGFVDLLALRILISILGVIGNTTLIISILQIKQLKSFEIFLLGLSVANLEEIIIVDIYDILLLRYSYRITAWTCRGLKFLMLSGEICSILFTVLISIYRYQKLHDIQRRANLPVFMDGSRASFILTIFCMAIAIVFSMPLFFVDMNWSRTNSSSLVCPADIFECKVAKCPSQIYKYTFLLVCNLLPLLIVTLTSVLIVRILLIQQRAVRARHTQVVSTTTKTMAQRRPNKSRLQRSTMAILAAMMLFQLNWSVYLILHLSWNPYTFPLWSEMEFFITTFYTAISPYIYGIGNNLFSVKRLLGLM